MSLWTLLRHRLRSYWRVPFFGRRALSLILGGFLALYLGGGLVLLGVVLDDIVREAVPGADPLLVASRWLLPLSLLYAALRVFVGSGLGTDPKPYQALPIRRSALVALLAVFALLSLWNAVPMAFVATVCIETALDGAPEPALRFGVVSVGVLGDATMLVSSHDLGHVTDVSDRIAILEAGEIVRDEPTDPDTLEDLTTYFAEAIRPKAQEPA